MGAYFKAFQKYFEELSDYPGDKMGGLQFVFSVRREFTCL